MDEITELDKRIALLDPALDRRTEVQFNGWSTYPVRRIWNAYSYFKRTNSGAGLVELLSLMEEEGPGWLAKLLNSFIDVNNPPGRPGAGRFYRLIENMNKDGRLIRFQKGLHHFREIRNNCAHHDPQQPKKDIEQAFSEFLDFMEWYFRWGYKNIPITRSPAACFAVLPEKAIIAGRFQVARYLGANARADIQTYEVRDLLGNHDIPYVVKRISVFSERYDDVIRAETKFHAHISGHPNINAYLSSHPAMPVGHVIKLEYIEGRTLQEWMEERDLTAPESLYDFLYIVDRVLDGLRHMHDNGYVHGGVSPETIIVENDGGVKIVNFDSCRLVSTASGSPCGNGVDGTFQLDTFDLGRIIESFISKGANTPVELEQLVAQAVHSDFKRRFKDARQMKQGLWPIYEELRFVRKGEGLSGKKIALISCTRRKLKDSAEARELYSASDCFLKTRNYVEHRTSGYDGYFIVSGRYGLVERNQVLDPYDCDLAEFTKEEQLSWAIDVARILKWKKADRTTEVVVHADPLYRGLLKKAIEAAGFKYAEGRFE